jgi:hypothetical protein
LGLTAELAATLGEVWRRRVERAAGWSDIDRDRRADRRRHGMPSMVVSVVIIAALLLVTALPLTLWKIGVIATEDGVGRIIVPGMLGFYVLMTVLLVWMSSRPRGRPVLPTAIVLDGPVSPDTVAQVQAETDREVRRIRLARAVESRRPAASLDRATRGGLLRAANLVVLVLVLILVIAGGTVALAGAGGGVVDYLMLYGVPVAVFGLLALLYWRRRVRDRAIQTALAPLGAWLGGAVHTSYQDAIAWLDGHWPGPTAPEDGHTTADRVSVAGVRRGYPVMVELEPRGRADEYATYPPRALVYLASDALPERPEAGTDADRLRASIGRAGFTVQITPATGLLARADPATVARLAGNLSGLTVLRPVIDDLAALAVATGASPPPDISGP